MSRNALRRDLVTALSRNSAELLIDTPNFVLANYLIACLDAWKAGQEALAFHRRVPQADANSLATIGEQVDKWGVPRPQETDDQ